jgi:succinoglycan biosynthesis protein ExoM
MNRDETEATSPAGVHDFSSSDRSAKPHICVCLCTYKRPELLRRSLEGLTDQETQGLFTYSIVVADNDRLESARTIVSETAARTSVAIRYCVEPRQNIALTRNKAVQNAAGDYVAFFDDDQFASKRWLLTLFEACRRYGVDGVLGPVKPHFDEEPPRWVAKGRFFERATYPTGFPIDGRKGRTGNALIAASLFRGIATPFRPEFRTGEDQDFFGRMIQQGHKFVWCNEAVAHEVVPPLRWKLSFLLRRALLRGATTRLQANFGTQSILKTIIAIPLYSIFLPLSPFLGYHVFISYLVKLFDHLGLLLGILGINLIREPYVTE